MLLGLFRRHGKLRFIVKCTRTTKRYVPLTILPLDLQSKPRGFTGRWSVDSLGFIGAVVDTIDFDGCQSFVAYNQRVR